MKQENLRSYHPLYHVYYAIKQRCKNIDDSNYRKYGGRGISICKEWDDSFELFKTWAINNGYRKGLQIDRTDNNGNYEPTNCRWVTSRVNSNNQRKTILITYKGDTKPLTEWADLLGIKQSTLRSRIQERRLPLDEAMQSKKLYKGFVNRRIK